MRRLRCAPFFLLVVLSGCASTKKKEPNFAVENSRVTEQRRMQVISHGDVESRRGAEIVVYDPEKKFDIGRAMAGGNRTFATDSASTKGFAYDQKVRPKNFQTREFAQAKSWNGQMTFATKTASTKTSTLIPNSEKKFETKTMGVKGARESDKNYETPDSTIPREFRVAGKSQKLLDEKYANRAPLTIDEVRVLLNKNK